MDPTEEEAQASAGTLIHAGLPALNTTTNVWQTGGMSVKQLMKVGVEVALVI